MHDQNDLTPEEREAAQHSIAAISHQFGHVYAYPITFHGERRTVLAVDPQDGQGDALVAVLLTVDDVQNIVGATLPETAVA